MRSFYGSKQINSPTTLKDCPCSTLAALMNCKSTNTQAKRRPKAPITFHVRQADAGSLGSTGEEHPTPATHGPGPKLSQTMLMSCLIFLFLKLDLSFCFPFHLYHNIAGRWVPPGSRQSCLKNSTVSTLVRLFVSEVVIASRTEVADEWAERKLVV